MSRRFQAKDHFEFRRIDGAEDSQARVGSTHADPFFAAITDFRKEIFDERLGNAKTPPGDSNLNPVGRLNTDEGGQIFQQQTAAQGYFDGGVGVTGQQRFVKEILEEFSQSPIFPGNVREGRGKHDENRRFFTDPVAAEFCDRLFDHRAQVYLFHNGLLLF